jgi:glycosyltransferase involved in cell wall biosynthesis
MRIVQVITQSSGGPVDHAIDVAAELSRRGHDSHLVGPGAWLVERLDAVDVTAHDVAVVDKQDLSGAAALLERVRVLRPDVLHCQDRRAGLLGRTFGRLSRTPALVYTLHGVADGLSDLVAGNVRAAPRRRRDSWYYLFAERWLHRATGGRIVVPSHAVAQFALEFIRLPADRVDVVPNGVDVARFVCRPAARHSAYTAVWLGLMAPVKRLDVLLGAVSEVSGLQLRLVGGGPEQATIAAEIAARGLGGRVTMPGPVADPAVALAESDVFVMTSAAENCPMSLLQAMACGLPIIATRVGGIPEMVRDGVDGLLVPPGDVSALADALRVVVANPEAGRTMGKQARERACDEFTIGRCVDGLLETYGKALSCG